MWYTNIQYGGGVVAERSLARTAEFGACIALHQVGASMPAYVRYKTPAVEHPCSQKDLVMLSRALRRAQRHDSGGSYSMAALAVRGKPHATGLNTLNEHAASKSEIYPEFCTTHAELNLWSKHPHLRGYTVYVAGIYSVSGNTMLNTKPCVYCAALLKAAGVKYVVYYRNGRPVKSDPESLTDIGAEHDGY